ncbi:MAG: methyl-accepting chemotaxis protein [Gammaproteobacteria bacterium]
MMLSTIGTRLKSRMKKRDVNRPPKAATSGARATLLQRLFGRLNLAQTFALVGVLFSVPLVLLLVYLVRELATSVNFSERERLGVPYMVPLTKVAANLPIHQFFAVEYAKGYNIYAARLQELDHVIDAQMAELDAVNAAQGMELDVHDQWKVLQEQWATMKSTAAESTVENVKKSHQEFADALLTFQTDVADNSKMTLDPQVETYYLISVIAEQLTQTSLEVGKVAALAAAHAGAQPMLSRVRALVAETYSDRLMMGVRGSLARSFGANGDIEDALGVALNAATEKTGSLLALSRSGLEAETGPAQSLDEMLAAYNEATGALVELGVGASRVLDALLAERIAAGQRRAVTDTLITAALSLLAIFLLTLLARFTIATARAQKEQADKVAADYQRNQDAILRLLDELGDLADGNLTVKAKVTEDFTGAIADSVNFTIGELRNLVERVNTATAEVTSKTEQAGTISARLLNAAKIQTQEIQDAGKRVVQVASGAKKVSETATESASVAQRSLQAAAKGASAVENSIKGMNDIRDQIQETAKRIKRLGESSQEVGEIIEMISDITEQTNVLALNAAIQAAAAGEAGRGFAVVAEEVQRLAERSGDATKQIGALIRTIQRDTQEAVAAMERSTVGVVEGAKLSDAAGEALTEIREVSKDLAGLIEQIFGVAREQAAAAADVSKRMESIMKITLQTTEGTKRATESVTQLTQVADELKTSVSGFKI